MIVYDKVYTNHPSGLPHLGSCTRSSDRPLCIQPSDGYRGCACQCCIIKQGYGLSLRGSLLYFVSLLGGLLSCTAGYVAVFFFRNSWYWNNSNCLLLVVPPHSSCAGFHCSYIVHRRVCSRVRWILIFGQVFEVQEQERSEKYYIQYILHKQQSRLET